MLEDIINPDRTGIIHIERGRKLFLNTHIAYPLILLISFFRFINEWRLFVRNPQKKELVTLIPNQILLCSHGGLVYPLDLSIESDYDSV